MPSGIYQRTAKHRLIISRSLIGYKQSKQHKINSGKGVANAYIKNPQLSINMSKRLKGKPSGSTGKHWKVKDTSNMKGHGSWITGLKQTKESNEKNRQSQLKRYKKKPVTLETRQKLRELRILKPIHNFNNTSIERKIAAELNSRKIDFKQNVGILNIANVDFYLPKYKIIIECDGCYYHACQQCGFIKYHQDAIARDAHKTKCLQQNGFEVHRFWEHEINKSAEKCVNKIFK